MRRVLHARDATGREIGRVLWTRVGAARRIQVVEDAQARARQSRRGVCGRHLRRARRQRASRDARRGRCWRPVVPVRSSAKPRTRPSPPATASRWRFEAGARVADLEFVQFHPTVLSVAGRPAIPAVGSAARRRRAPRQRAGRAFHARDTSRPATWHRATSSRAPSSGRCAGPARRSTSRWRTSIRRTCGAGFRRSREAVRQAGLDLATDRIPVSPAAHYVMGGVETDLDGRTSVAGLFAAGEVACTGVHGANRLASNSLLEGLVFGARAAEAMRGTAQRPCAAGGPAPPVPRRHPLAAAPLPRAAEVRDADVAACRSRPHARTVSKKR